MFCVSLVPSNAQQALQITNANQPAYDLVIRGGKIVDGTGNPWFMSDVAVKRDRIVAIGQVPAGSAKREIDARGLVVAPGFIDMHSHSDFTLFEDGNAQSKIRQGVTTDVLGEGSSGGPNTGKLLPKRVKIGDRTVEIKKLGDYFRAIDEATTSINIASYVGIGNVWQSVMGDSFERPTPEQIGQMQELVAAAMRDGAFGLSTQVMMPPGSLATTDDLVALCEPVRKYGGIYSSHIRNEGIGVFDSVTEAIAIGERAGVPVDVIHIKIADQQSWGLMRGVVDLIEKARGRGVNVQANVYPYTRGNNNLSSIIPPWAHEGGRDQMLARLKDPADRKRLKHDINNGIAGWYNHYTAVGKDWSRMLVSADNPYRGMTMDQVIAKRTEGVSPTPDPLDVLFDLLIEQNGSVSTVYAHHEERDMNLAMQQPWCSIGSDGSALAIEGPLRRGNPHPRNFGTFPRVLGVYVREREVLRLEDAVRKMTSLNAAKLGIRDRGLLRPGLFADITVFDPEKIIDRATYTEPFQYNEGIAYVIVNGQVVLEGEKHTGARPGRALRHTAAPVNASENAEKQSPIEASSQAIQVRGVEHAGEGPAWDASTNSLFFVGGNRTSRLKPDGSVEVVRQPDGGSNGLLFDKQGRLLACEAAARRVTRIEADGAITVLADSYQGKKFNSPNDLTIDSRGRIYFTDPRYGNRDSMELRDDDGKLVEGVYRIDAPGKVHRIIAPEVDRPNGVLVSPDDKHIFVADNNNNTKGGARKLWRFDLRADGTVNAGSRKLIFDWKSGRGPDGIKIDRQNRLYVAAGFNKANPPYETTDEFKGGVYVLSYEGKLLDFIAVPRDEVTNCAFGSRDLRTLYITAGSTLWNVRVDTSGYARFAKE
ncbi:MAG: SMP-30/gluconolactonase/LRE family protein [Pirellulales bacterium]